MTSSDLISIEQVEDVLLHGGDLQIIESDQIQVDIVQQILSAGSLEEAFGEFSATSAEDVEGVLLDVVGIAWAKSAYEDGPAVYALCKCVLVESKQEIVVSMGGKTTMARFVWALRQDAMPIRGVFEYEQSRSNHARRFLTFKLAPKTAK